jgi:hypothetical protein
MVAENRKKPMFIYQSQALNRLAATVNLIANGKQSVVSTIKCNVVKLGG